MTSAVSVATGPISADELNAAVRLIACAVRDDALVREHLTRRIATEVAAETPARAAEILGAAARLCEPFLRDLCDGTHNSSESSCDPGRLEQIRDFFLAPSPAYSLIELATFWQVSLDDAMDICHDELMSIELDDASDLEFRLDWATALRLTTRFTLIRPFDVERALGDEFGCVRGEQWKTHAVVIRPPLFLAQAFKLDPAVPVTLALAHRIEHLLLQIFGDSGDDTSV